jgi:hypothetical protein
MGISLNDLKKVVAEAVEEKLTEAKNSRTTIETMLAANKAQAEGFWKKHGKVVLVSFGVGFGLAIVLSVLGLSLK